MTVRSRRIFRCPVDDPKTLTARVRHGGASLSAQAHNVSESGMLLSFVEGGYTIPIGSRVDIALQTPGGSTRMAAIVRHSSARRCGVEFVGMDGDDEQFEPPQRLKQSLSTAQKLYIEKRRRQMN